MTSGTCDSCGDTDESLVAVHRKYVTPAAWDTEGKVDVQEAVEKWCPVCMTHYPHEIVSEQAD